MNSKTLLKWFVDTKIFTEAENMIEVGATLLCWRKTCLPSICFQRLHQWVMDEHAEIKLSQKQGGDGGVSVLSRWSFLFSEIPEA